MRQNAPEQFGWTASAASSPAQEPGSIGRVPRIREKKSIAEGKRVENPVSTQ
jgi:hypothetical protein